MRTIAFLNQKGGVGKTNLAEAPGFGQSIFAYAPRTMGALDFANLCREIDARGLS